MDIIDGVKKCNDFIRLKKNFLLLFLIIFITMFEVSGQCGDGILQPGEYCDPGLAVDDFDQVYFDGIQTCAAIPADPLTTWEGDIGCYLKDSERECQVDITECNEVSIILGGACPTCESCDELEEGCTANWCIGICGGGFGFCQYVGPGAGDDCESCIGVTSCGDYQHTASCGLGGTDACNIAENNPEWDGYFCEWVNDECVQDLSCQWSCGDLYGDCQGDGFRYKNSGASCQLIDGEEDCLVNEPSSTFPEKIACGFIESNFPVFTWLNLAMSIVLLIGYYSTTFFKKERWRRKN